jgi:hypothetical protein
MRNNWQILNSQIVNWTISWRTIHRGIAIAAATVLLGSMATLAAAQRVGGEERNGIFAAAAKEPTSIKGVSTFSATPKGFNPLTATNRELLAYGLPQRPDKTASPVAYQHWEKGMLAMKTRVIDVEAKPFESRNAIPTGQAETANVDGTTSVSFNNWSGIAQTNKLKSWNNKTSFDEVVSVWNVPVAEPPFGSTPCSDGPWYEVTWNGIDGYSNGDVVQGGSFEYWDGGGCKGSIEYFGWVEWYPSYSVLELYCPGPKLTGKTPCPVSPGDDFYVVTYGAPGTSDQNVFVEDITQQWSGTLTLSYVSGPGLVGSAAEYIVERPGISGGLAPLVNYVFEFFDDSFAYDGNGTLFYPGNAGATTSIITMLADDNSTPISFPTYGSSGNQGKYSLWVQDENCAFSGGCVK